MAFRTRGSVNGSFLGLIINSTLADNIATGDFGGAISNVGEATITGTILSGNRTDIKGGGIHNIGTMTITSSTISGNDQRTSEDSDDGGGGIYNSGTLTITSSTISGNTSIVAGGIYNTGTATITNSTISGNAASGDPFFPFPGGEGGGILNSGTVTIANSTISGNTADFGTGGIHNSSGTVYLINAIIANNTFNCSGSMTSLGHNLASDGGCNLTDPTDLPFNDPLLGPLEDNGGPTETHELLPGSPAIDAGGLVAALSDQRGVTRPPGGATDIGAFESQGNCTLILDVSYTAGTATIEATVGALVPATKNFWGTFQSNVLNLESTAIPVTDPPAKTVVFSGAVPAQGVVAVFATLTTPDDGIICSSLENLDTGPAP